MLNLMVNFTWVEKTNNAVSFRVRFWGFVCSMLSSLANKEIQLTLNPLNSFHLPFFPPQFETIVSLIWIQISFSFLQQDFSLGASVPRIRCWARLPGWRQQISPWKLLFPAKGRSPAQGSTCSFRLGSKKGGKNWRVWNRRRPLRGKWGWEREIHRKRVGRKVLSTLFCCLGVGFGSWITICSTWGGFQFTLGLSEQFSLTRKSGEWLYQCKLGPILRC